MDNHNSQGHGHSAAALLDLVPTRQATHRAVRDGDWGNPNTWQNGRIPKAGDRVVIPSNRTVTYNRNSDVELDWVRVDGKLEFDQTRNTKIVLDTFVVAPEGELEIGTNQSPIQAQKSARIEFTAKGRIDASDDPQRLGRGIISHGKVNIVGADKLDHVALKQDALKGDRSLVLDLPSGTNRPKGWQVGDKLVLGGTSFNQGGSNANNSKFRDEVLTITAIQGNRIRFTNDDIRSGDNRVLRFDHTRPNTLKNRVDLYVANISRNVSFETRDADNVPTQQRAHAMFMHNPDVNIQHAGFYGLGRTDKTRPIDDPGVNVNGTPGRGTNPRGRYALHVHQTGIDVNDGSVNIEGNAVVGSPGWGIVQHGSKGVLSDNVVFDVAGAGIVSEDGNESGWWINNITIKTTGDGTLAVTPAELRNLQNYDLANQGEGYWLTGAAQISMRGNIAVSAAGGGLNVFSKAFGVEAARPIDTIPTRILSRQLQNALPANTSRIAIENVPASFLKGFETYNSTNGVFFWQHQGNNDGQLTFNAPNLDPAHNIRTTLRDFKLWGILDRGVEFQYSTQVDLENGLIAGSTQRKGNFGIQTNGPSQDLKFNRLLIEGFREGITVPRNGRLSEDTPLVPSVLQNSTLRNNDLQLSDRISFQYPDNQDAFPDYFQIRNTRFLGGSVSRAPVIRQRAEALGGVAYQFDASGSFDPDVPASRQNTKRGIVAYGWDFDADGVIDDYGRLVRHRFTSAGRKNYTLTVWDNQGQTTRLRQSLTVQSSPYRNLFLDSSFDRGTRLVSQSKFQGSTGAGFGWLTSGWRVNATQGNGGALEALNGRKGVAQVIYDQKSRVGRQVLSLDVKRTDRDDLAGKAVVKVWGLNGEFTGAGWRTVDNGPMRVGALPLRRSLLLNETVVGGKNSFRTFRKTLNLGSQGFDFLVVQINALDVNRAQGDRLFIDDVSLATEGQPTTSAAADVNPDVPGSLFERQRGQTSAQLVSQQTEAPPREPLQLADAQGDRAYLASDDVQGDRTAAVQGDMPKLIRGTVGDDLLRGYGNAERLEAGNGNDVLVGGRGVDVLSGGLGRDKFRWFQLSHGGDRILDFDAEQDRLEIHGQNFGGELRAGTLRRDQFVVGSQATQADHRLIYNPKTGNLLFDSDGVRGNAATLLAQFVGKPDLQASMVQIL